LRKGPSNNPWDELGPKKNILDLLANEDYKWLASSNLSDLDKEVILDSKDRTEDTSMEENLSLVVFGQGKIQGALAMYVEPFVS